METAEAGKQADINVLRKNPIASSSDAARRLPLALQPADVLICSLRKASVRKEGDERFQREHQ